MDRFLFCVLGSIHIISTPGSSYVGSPEWSESINDMLNMCVIVWLCVGGRGFVHM